jgi:Protein of unknown function (DUF2442)/Helix-turn-helix domain
MQPDHPKIRSVRPDTGRRLVVGWRGGAETVIDVAPHLARYAVFAPLRPDARGKARGTTLFRAVTVGDWGWIVHWTDEMEIADTLWRLALEQGAAWLRTWRTAHGMTQQEAARALGVSPRVWRYYEAGTHRLRRPSGSRRPASTPSPPAA